MCGHQECDFVSTADTEDLRWLESMLRDMLETTDIIGHEKLIKELN